MEYYVAWIRNKEGVHGRLKSNFQETFLGGKKSNMQKSVCKGNYKHEKGHLTEG